MGWSNGGAYRSGTAMYELGQHMAHALTASQWRTVKPLFDQADTADGPFSIAPADTQRMAEVFRAASAHRKIPRSWRTSASELAAVAAQHAAARKSWRWS